MSWYKKSELQKCYRDIFYNLQPTHTLLNGNLYVTIYYFFNKDLHLDTENLSKPIWDCLNGILLNDNQQIRIVGSFDLAAGNYSVIDLSGLQGNLVVDLLDAFESEEYIIYVECGNFKPSMYKFNIK